MKKFLNIFFALSLVLSCAQCGKDGGDDKGGDEDKPVTGTQIVENGKSSYNIVYPYSGGTASRVTADYLARAIKTVTGCSLNVVSDQTEITDHEILLGATSRSETATVKETIKGNGYSIFKSGKKLVLYGTNANYIAIVLKKFETVVLKNNAIAGDGFLKFQTIADLTTSGDKTPINLCYVVKNKFKITTSLTKVCSCPKEGAVYVAQGACTDGTYIYFVNRNKNDNGSIVYKYDATTFKKVSQTALFDGGHSNDMTYDSLNDRIISLNGGVTSSLLKVVSIIDPKTMEVTTPYSIATGLTAITYNAKTNRYAGRNGQNLYIMDENFNTVSKGSRSDGSSLTSQGMGSDEDYFYFPMSGSKNAILVYDWNFNFIRNIELDTSQESESLFKLGDDYYINFYKSGNGAELYRLNIDSITYIPSL